MLFCRIYREVHRIYKMPARIFDDLDIDGGASPPLKGERIPDPVVVSGVSGRLPESDNVEEFRQHLINGEDMVTESDRRWPPGWC